VTTNPEPPITQYAAASRHVVNAAGKIVLDANDEIGKGTYSFEKWAQSANQLFNLALGAGLQLAPPKLPFPCFPQATGAYAESAFIKVTADNTCERAVSVAESFAKLGDPSCVIPDEFVTFSIVILPRGGDKFRVKVTWPDLRSGTYRGKIRLTRIGSTTPGDVVEERIIDL
jgi:hypothetical protein